MTCMTIAVVFAAMFAVVFPLLGPAIVVLLFLTLVGTMNSLSSHSLVTNNYQPTVS
jgi:hypothetical protein